MKSYKTLLFALAAIAMQFAVACNNDDPQTTPQPEPPTPEQPQPLTESHTLVIFMQGNNGLAEFMDSNLQRILAAYYDIPEGDFRILVFYDRGNYTRLTELYMNDGMAKQRLIEEYDTSTSTVDKAFIESVLARVKEEAPADSYGLILSSHGGGWVPSDLYDVYLLDEGTRATDPQIRPMFYGQDDYDCMEIPDLVGALDDIHFNYIIFDACFMGNIEALYDLRNSADYIVASAAEVLGAGFPYETMLPMLFEYDDHNLKAICEEYMEYYANSSGTVALIDCQQLEPLAEAMRAVMAEMGDVNVKSVQAYDAFEYHLYFDLLHYVELGVENSTAFEKALNKAVLYSGYTDTILTSTGDVDSFELARSCGVSCYITQKDCPATEAAWRDTAWAKAITE